MASLNRGYLVYYWGDIDRDSEPPYQDIVVATKWSYTRSRTADLLAADDYDTRESVARRTLDLMTFLDFARFHQTSLSDEETGIVSIRIAELKASGDLPEPLSTIATEVLGYS